MVHLRWRHRLAPVRIAARVGLAPSTLHAVLVRSRLNRLSHIDRRAAVDRPTAPPRTAHVSNAHVLLTGVVPPATSPSSPGVSAANGSSFGAMPRDRSGDRAAQVAHGCPSNCPDVLRRRLSVALLAGLAFLAGAPAGAAPGDPRIGEQYALTQMRVPQAWSVAQGRGVVVAVVDSGVDLGHPDLRGRLVPGATFLRCGDRPCGDGDWRSGPAARRHEAYGHGTHVAGAIVAGRNNGHGIAGVAPLAKVMPIKMTDRRGNSDPHDVALAIRWAVAHGADVVNASLGYPASVSAEIAEAANWAMSRGVVIVASAGNRSEPGCLHPAAVPGVVCVTATDRNEAPAAYSSGAVKDGMRSVAAPGGAGLPGHVYTVAVPQLPVPACEERILSTWPRGDAGAGRCPGEGGYRYLSGTSLSSPHVAGVAALLLSQGRTAARTVEILLATARTPAVGPGVWTPQYGHGIVDAAAAVRAPR